MFYKMHITRVSHQQRWFSGRIAASHAADRGSIPRRCILLLFIIILINLLLFFLNKYYK